MYNHEKLLPLFFQFTVKVSHKSLFWGEEEIQQGVLGPMPPPDAEGYMYYIQHSLPLILIIHNTLSQCSMIQCVCVFYMQYQSESWFNSGEGDPPSV